MSSCVVYFPSTDPNLIDQLLHSLRHVFVKSAAPLVRSTTSIHVFRPVVVFNPPSSNSKSTDPHPDLDPSHPPPPPPPSTSSPSSSLSHANTLLYVFEWDGFERQDGMYLHTTTSNTQTSNAEDPPPPLPSGSIQSSSSSSSSCALHGYHALGFLQTLKNQWVLRQTAKIEGVSLDLRDFVISMGQLKLSATLIGTLVHVTYKVPLPTSTLLEEFLQQYLLVPTSSSLPVVISPMDQELMACYVHVFRKERLL
ncbi:hypothetical protein HMI55_005610 [Coelomomyces lativittatus]|nr:hypothetical protein HMI55_005610 [Coelomomyces lativittatus]